MKIRRPVFPSNLHGFHRRFVIAIPWETSKVSMFMKVFWLILGLAVVPLFQATAQVTVTLSLDQSQFLPSEKLPVAVHITNLSGQTLHLGADPKWVTFNIEAEDDFIVVKNSNPPVQGPFNLNSSEVATKTVNLEPCFDLRRIGHYRIIAIVHIQDWNTDVASAPCGFDVISGAKLWSQTFGLPLPAGVSNQPPEIRKYTLIQANYLHSQLRMYVQLSNESGSSIFKVQAIGPMVAFSEPEAQIDRFSDLHVLYQSSARGFLYSVINPDGRIVQQEVFDYVGVRPRLRTGNDGNIIVYGGEARIKPQSIPQVRLPDELGAPVKP